MQIQAQLKDLRQKITICMHDAADVQIFQFCLQNGPKILMICTSIDDYESSSISLVVNVQYFLQ